MLKKIDLEKSISELNQVINKEEKPTGHQSLLAKALEKLGFTKDSASNPDLLKSIQDAATADAAATVVADEDTDTTTDDDLEVPNIEEANAGGVDAGEFIAKALAYMEGVANLVKGFKTEIATLRADNSTLAKAIESGNFGIAALVNSQTALHKSLDVNKETIASAATKIIDRTELPNPSAAQRQKEVDLTKEITDKTTLKKARFDDAEVNLLAKGLREHTITEQEYQAAQKDLVLPARLLN